MSANMGLLYVISNQYNPHIYTCMQSIHSLVTGHNGYKVHQIFQEYSHRLLSSLDHPILTISIRLPSAHRVMLY